MPDMVPVGNTIIPPDPNQGFQTMSALMGLKRQQQALQTGQIEQQTALAESQQAQQKNKELQSAQNIALNGAKSGNYTKSDGTLDRQKMADDISKVAPTYGQGVASSLLSQANEVVSNMQAHQNLATSKRKQMGDTFASLAADPQLDNSKVIDGFNELADTMNDPEQRRMLFSMATHLPPNASAQQLRDLMGKWSAAATGEPQSAPSTVSTGAQIIPGATNKFTGGFTPAQPGIAAQIPPSADVITDAYGRQYRFNRQTNQVEPIGTGSGPSVTGEQPKFTQPAPDQPEVTKNIESARTAGDQVGLNRHINQQLLRLSADTKTGPGTERWHNALGALGAPFGANIGADYQLIGAYLDRQAALNAQSMGLPNTNSGLQTSQSLSGTASYNPAALQAKVKLADTLNTAADQFRRGLDKAVGVGSNQNPAAYQQYRAAWAANFDPNIFRAENAIRDGDKAELAKIKAEVGLKGMKELALKRKALKQLSDTGFLQ